MRTILLTLVFIFSSFFLSCDDGNDTIIVDNGQSVNDEDTGHTGDTGNTGNTGNTGDTCTGSDKFCHSHDGLNWSDASSNKMDWDDAIAYCEELGGRLPTISELRALIQNCPGTETGGECVVTDSCLSFGGWNDPCDGCEYDESGKYSVFGDTKRFWSSSELSDCPNNAWLVHFNYGDVFYSNEGSNDIDVRCVR